MVSKGGCFVSGERMENEAVEFDILLITPVWKVLRQGVFKQINIEILFL